MDDSAIAVFTFRGRAQMEEQGGSFAWALDMDRAARCKYVVCVRNRHNPDHPPEGDEPHSHAFLVAENAGLEPVGDRWLIRFGRIATIDQPVEWLWRDKRYMRLSDIGLSPARIERQLIDVGCNVVFGRTGHSASPSHAPIVVALREHLAVLGWAVASAAIAIRPDLVATANSRLALFEVKPDSSMGSFFTAIGQLVVYRHAMQNIDHAFLVAPGLPIAERASFKTILSQLNLKFLQCKQNAGQYEFTDLATALQ